MPSHDHTVELQNLFLEPAQLSPKRRETRTDYHRYSLVTWISDDIEQFLNSLASDRSNDPELGKMRPDHIDHRSLLADEQMARWHSCAGGGAVHSITSGHRDTCKVDAEAGGLLKRNERRRSALIGLGSSWQSRPKRCNARYFNWFLPRRQTSLRDQPTGTAMEELIYTPGIFDRNSLAAAKQVILTVPRDIADEFWQRATTATGKLILEANTADARRCIARFRMWYWPIGKRANWPYGLPDRRRRYKCRNAPGTLLNMSVLTAFR